MSEAKVQNEIRIFLSKKGFINFRCNVGKVRMSDGRFFDTGLPKGHSDLVAYKDGRAYFFEVKYGKNKARPEQLNFIEQMKKNGCVAGVVYSVEDVEKLLSNCG